jgi:pyruvate/2-oxoglutarate dehydrogenase complex dihydrolipoamide acyltransferase (E2) component
MGFQLARRVSTWRKIAIAAWTRPDDPTIYATLTLDAGPALEYLARVRAETRVRCTITHLVGRAVAVALRAHPDINGKIVGRDLYLRDTVDIFYQVSMKGGRDLGGAKITRADEKDLVEIATELASRATKVREDRDPELQTSRATLDLLPGALRRPVLRLVSYLTNDLGMSLPALKLKADTFGSAMITSMGMFGVDLAYSPLFPLGGCPLIVLVGEVHDVPVADRGQVVIRPQLNLNVSFDHRFIDGHHAAMLARSVRDYFASPESHERRPPARTEASTGGLDVSGAG